MSDEKEPPRVDVQPVDYALREGENLLPVPPVPLVNDSIGVAYRAADGSIKYMKQ